MTNEVGRSLFAKAGELGAPVGFMCMKVQAFVPSSYWYFLAICINLKTHMIVHGKSVNILKCMISCTVLGG